MNKLQNIEVELTFPLYDHVELQKQLNNMAKLEHKNLKQKDTYYSAPHRNFLKKVPISEWLRIRETDKGTTLNYKYWHNEGDKQAVSCDEFETPTNANIVKEIFKRLNFQELIVVDKVHSTWMYKNVEIAIDEIKELGWFLELEAKGQHQSIDDAKNHLYKIIKELKAKTGPQDYKGFPHLLLEKKKLL
ncbi:class IV adenylate cyclase [Patescibacteria group bacterium]